MCCRSRRPHFEIFLSRQRLTVDLDRDAVETNIVLEIERRSHDFIQLGPESRGTIRRNDAFLSELGTDNALGGRQLDNRVIRLSYNA